MLIFNESGTLKNPLFVILLEISLFLTILVYVIQSAIYTSFAFLFFTDLKNKDEQPRVEESILKGVTFDNLGNSTHIKKIMKKKLVFQIVIKAFRYFMFQNSVGKFKNVICRKMVTIYH